MKTIDGIMKEQFKRRSLKYRLFFMGLLVEKYIFTIDRIDNSNKRGLLLRNYYFLMRYLDDITDGDITIESYKNIEDRVKYLEEKLEFIIYGNTPQDEVDKMIYDCHNLANEIGFSMNEESGLIVRSLIFDGKRLLEWEKNQEFKIASDEELRSHFYDLDILGTTSGCLKIYKEDERYLEVLYPIGTACRKYYDIRDFIEDCKKGLVNISIEDMAKYSISESDLRKIISISNKFIGICKNKGFNNEELVKLIPEPILSFLFDSCSFCEDQLNDYYNAIQQSEISSLRKSTVITLKIGYERSIQKYLKRISSNMRV